MSVLINELKAQRAAAKDTAQALRDTADASGRDLTEEERGKLQANMTEFKRLGIEIEEREDLEAADLELTTADRQSVPVTPQAAPLRRVPDIRVVHHSGDLKGFTGPDATRNAYASGQFLLATLFRRPDAREWCINNGLLDARAMATNINPAGGFLVPDEFENAVIRLRLNYGVFRKEGRVYPMASDHVVIPRRVGGLDVYFPGENVAVTESETTWNQVGLTAKKAATLTRMSTEVSEDSIISLADDLADEAAYAFAEKEDRCGFLGTGAGATYAGMVGINVHIIDGTHEAGSVEIAAAHDLMSEVDMTDCASVLGMVPEYAMANAKWYCSKIFKSMVFDRLKLAAGGALVAERAGIAGVTPEFMGHEIVISNTMPAAPATDYTDAVMCLCGDLKQCSTFGTRRGITVKVDESRYLEYDQIAVLATERFDIVCHDLGDNTTAGPMVAMVGGT